jgi:hypothetical protein
LNGFWLKLGITAMVLFCAPVRAASGSDRLPASQPLSLLETPDTAPLARNAEIAVRNLLALRGHAFSGTADFGVQVTLARRDDGTGFATPGNYETALGKRRRQHLTLCDAGIFRMSVAIIDLRSAAIAYRGHAEEVSCHEPDAKGLATLATSALQSLR